MAIVHHVLPRKRPLYHLSPGHIVDEETGCWNWTGSHVKGGHPVANYKGTNWLAARAYYDCFVGPIPDDMFVIHDCENKSCVNPRHLSLCSKIDVLRDCNGYMLRSEAAEIWRLRNQPLSVVCAMFPHLTKDQITPIRSGRTWKGVK